MSADTRVGLILALTVNGLAVSSYPDMVTVSQTAERYGSGVGTHRRPPGQMCRAHP